MHYVIVVQLGDKMDISTVYEICLEIKGALHGANDTIKLMHSCNNFWASSEFVNV